MCTVNIQVDEALLRDVKPELDSTAAIRLWVQELVNLRIQELINEDEETMDIEEARAMVHETIKKEYALPWTGDTITIVDACHAQNMRSSEGGTKWICITPFALWALYKLYTLNNTLRSESATDYKL